ncbi:MAG: hypothetical protein WDO73_02245 [Ignavibacteriota bacterium]
MQSFVKIGRQQLAEHNFASRFRVFSSGHKMRATSLLALFGLIVASLQAQTGSDTFEVASVKVAAQPAGRGPGGPGGGRGGRGSIGGPGTNDPSRIQFQSAT